MSKVGFTIGVFDLLHDGHRNLIREAQKSCDLLIVGLVSDWLTMMQKGSGRPYDTYSTRKINILAEFPDVKIVNIDSLKLPSEMIDIIDVVVVGPDQVARYYEKNCSPGWEFIVVPRTPAISTTALGAALNKDN